MPITLGVGITALGLDPTSITTGLGYTPVNKAGDTMTGPLLQASGTAAAPSYSFSSDVNTGFYGLGAGVLRFAASGVDQFQATSAGVQLASGSSFRWASTTVGTATDLLLARDAAGTLAQRSGTDAQGFRLYNTYTDSSNYERFSFQWSGNTALFSVGAAGTGSARDLIMGTDGTGSYYFRTNGASRWRVSPTGDFIPNSNGSVGIGAASTGITKLYIDYTNTGTVGAVTINKAAGRVNLAAAGTSLVVTNTLVTAASKIFLSPGVPGNAAAVGFYVTPAAGSFTITATPAVTNQTAIDFFVVSSD